MKLLRSREADALKFLNNLDQIKVPGLHPSMSMTDIVSHIEHCISEQMTSGNPTFAGDSQQSRLILEEITRYLFNDSQAQVTAASDEKFLMSRVNSLCCLLQKDPSTSSTAEVTNVRTDLSVGTNGGGEVGESNLNLELSCKSNVMESKGQQHEPSTRKQVSGSGIPRKESVGDLLLNLPRIASLPQFLFPMSEDSGNRVR